MNIDLDPIRRTVFCSAAAIEIFTAPRRLTVRYHSRKKRYVRRSIEQRAKESLVRYLAKQRFDIFNTVLGRQG